MKLKGREKKAWWDFKRITDSKKIPVELSGITSIDSNADDDFLYGIISRVKIIREIYFKGTLITDEGVKYISQVRQLKSLTLAKHNGITNASLPYLNRLVDLEYLDLSKTQITIEDLSHLTELKSLKELYVSSDHTEPEYLTKQVVLLKSIFPDCMLYINYERFD